MVGPVVLERTELSGGLVLVTDYEDRQRSPHATDPKMPFETRIVDPEGAVRCGPLWSQHETFARMAHNSMLAVARRRGL